MTGSQFVVTDNGRNALRGRADGPGERPDRSELAAVLYVRVHAWRSGTLHALTRTCMLVRASQEPNAFGLKGPRRMTILMPPLGDTPWLVHQV